MNLGEELLKENQRGACICLTVEFKRQQSFSAVDDSPFNINSFNQVEPMNTFELNTFNLIFFNVARSSFKAT